MNNFTKSEPNASAPPSHDVSATGSRCWFALVAFVGLPSAGAWCAFLLLSEVLIPTVGLGELDRIRLLGDHLRSDLPAPPLAMCWGNSIVREGIDAAIVENQAPGWRAENYGLSAADLTELQIALPAMLARKPSAVVIGLTPWGTRLKEPDIGKMHAYGLARFPRDWPANWEKEQFPGLDSESWAALRADTNEHLIFFRRAPLDGLDYAARVLIRGDRGKNSGREWSAPYEMQRSIGGERLARHVEVIQEEVQAFLNSEDRRGEVVPRFLADEIRSAGSEPVFLLLPVHPLLQDFTEDLGTRLHQHVEEVASHGGVVADARHLLEAEAFADAVHPNAEGRATLSRFLGTVLNGRTR